MGFERNPSLDVILHKPFASSPHIFLKRDFGKLTKGEVYTIRHAGAPPFSSLRMQTRDCRVLTEALCSAVIADLRNVLPFEAREVKAIETRLDCVQNTPPTKKLRRPVRASPQRATIRHHLTLDASLAGANVGQERSPSDSLTYRGSCTIVIH